MTITADAIDRSISRDAIVHLDYDDAVAADLRAECDDSVENGDVGEYWGERDGQHWRVHLTRGVGG